MNPEQSNNNENDWESQLADYALGVMSADAAAQFEQGLADCRAHVTLADQYAHAIGLVGLAVSPSEPPAGHRERFLALIGSTTQEAPQERAAATGRTGPLPIISSGMTPPYGIPVVGQQPSTMGPEAIQATAPHPIDLSEYRARRGITSAIPLVASIAATILVLIAVWGWFSTRNEINSLQAQLDHAETELVQAQTDAANAKKQNAELQKEINIPPGYLAFPVQGQKDQPKSTGIAFVNPGTGDFELLAQDLQIVPDNETYEMWWLPPNNGAPVPAGTFKTDASGDARYVPPPPPDPLSSYAAIAVSREKAPGGPVPQGPIVLVGTYTLP